MVIIISKIIKTILLNDKVKVGQGYGKMYKYIQ